MASNSQTSRRKLLGPVFLQANTLGVGKHPPFLQFSGKLGKLVSLCTSVFTSVSFVGSTALADELMLLGKKYATGVIVTQVVPAVDGHSSLVLDYKSSLAKYFPGDAPDYVSLEGYVDATALIAALQRNGPDLDTERLVGTLENLRDLDLGLGTSVTFSRSDHQGVHKVWGTQLDETGHYQPIDLQ